MSVALSTYFVFSLLGDCCLVSQSLLHLHHCRTPPSPTHCLLRTTSRLADRRFVWPACLPHPQDPTNDIDSQDKNFQLIIFWCCNNILQPPLCPHCVGSCHELKFLFQRDGLENKLITMSSWFFRSTSAFTGFFKLKFVFSFFCVIKITYMEISLNIKNNTADGLIGTSA